MSLLSDIKKKKLFQAKYGLRGFKFLWEVIIENIELLVKSLNDLKIELSGFRSEMKEFKKAVEKRVDSLDVRSVACQNNPMVCATARRLEEHIKVDAGKGSRTVAVIACVISCFNVAVTIITLVAKGS